MKKKRVSDTKLFKQQNPLDLNCFEKKFRDRVRRKWWQQ